MAYSTVAALTVLLAVGCVRAAPAGTTDTNEPECAEGDPMKQTDVVVRCQKAGGPFCPETHFCSFGKRDNEPGVCCPKLKPQQTTTESTTDKEGTVPPPLRCTPIEDLQPLAPGCKYESSKVVGSDGCPQPPRKVCSAEANDCIAVSLPVLSSLCKFGPAKNDSKGCPIAPDIICESQEAKSGGQPQGAAVTAISSTTTGAATQSSALPSGSSTQAGLAPAQPNPVPQAPVAQANASSQSQPPPPAASSSQLSSNASVVGAPLAPPPVQPVQPIVVPLVSTSNVSQLIVSQIAASFNETTEEPPRNFTFEEMLGDDFLKFMNRSHMPQPEEFRKKSGPPSTGSGKFHPCKVHSDCFQFREPAEWCKPKNNIRWNEKSCFCATDTMTPTCIVERTDNDKTEWTFCADSHDLKCL